MVTPEAGKVEQRRQVDDGIRSERDAEQKRRQPQRQRAARTNEHLN